MRKIKFFLSMGLVVLVIYTLFAVQNKISIPVRIMFDEPRVYFLPLIVLLSFIFGSISGSMFTLFYRLAFKKNLKPAGDTPIYAQPLSYQSNNNSPMPELEVQGNSGSYKNNLNACTDTDKFTEKKHQSIIKNIGKIICN